MHAKNTQTRPLSPPTLIPFGIAALSLCLLSGCKDSGVSSASVVPGRSGSLPSTPILTSSASQTPQNQKTKTSPPTGNSSSGSMTTGNSSSGAITTGLPSGSIATGLSSGAITTGLPSGTSLSSSGPTLGQPNPLPSSGGGTSTSVPGLLSTGVTPVTLRGVPVSVPEPGAPSLLFGMGCVGGMLARRRRRM